MRLATRLALRLALALAAFAGAGRARAEGADPLSDAAILGRSPGIRVESVRVRFTQLDQSGTGYQSQAGPPQGPGSQQLVVSTPQAELVVKQGRKLTYRLEVPFDIVTAASPDAVDIVSSSSRRNEAGSIDLTTTYQSAPETAVFLRGAFHLEENFRAWTLGAGVTHAMADDNAVLSASLNEVIDWFDGYDIHGVPQGHVWRTSSNANLGLTQLLSPTTVAHVGYGGTLQRRNLGVTWNSVPLLGGGLGPELLPEVRHRHALLGRIVQALPWRGTLKQSYRLYLDSWGIIGNTLETQLYQRLGRGAYVRGLYRLHHQSAADFFTTSAVPGVEYRTADSDLDGFTAHSYGAKLVLVGRTPGVREVTFDLGFERYHRSNDLRASLYSCGLSLLF